MHQNIERILISEQQLQDRIRELAQQISRDYAGKDPVFVGVLKGVVVFYADLIKRVDIPCEMDFMCISSYAGTKSTGTARVKMDVTVPLKDRHVGIVEDIFDTGNSLNFTYSYLLSKNPASVKIVTLLDKPARRNPEVTLKADYVGFEVPNEFVVGYGMDFNEHYRNLPYVGILSPEAYM